MKFNISQIISRLEKKQTTGKKQPFVILNTDFNGGLYIRSIISQLKNNKLVEIDKAFRVKAAKSTKLGDIIVVGDCDSVFEYDYRVLPKGNQDEIKRLDGRKYKVYDSVRDYSTILNKIESYAKANSARVADKACVVCPLLQQQRNRPVKKIKVKRQQYVPQLNIDVRYDEECPVFAAKNVRNYRRVDPVSADEKCTFFDDYVKIGFNQFDIEYDCFDNSYIQDGRRNKYYISEDRFGRRFLVTK